MNNHVKIICDDECNADVFWGLLDAEFPQIATDLRRDGEAVVSESDWQIIQQLNGFDSGPDHAPTAVFSVND